MTPCPAPAPETHPATGLREAALQALQLREPPAKVAATHALWERLAELPDGGGPVLAAESARLLETPPTGLPGRPDQPVLVPPADVPHRTPFTPEGLAAQIHAIAHIEFNAINLALDAVWRFSGMPADYYRDWLRVAHEEATHYGLLAGLLASMGHAYGDFEAHDGLWTMCVRTQDDITARMALVPRTLEARGLDATPLIQRRLRQVATPHALRAVEILDIILRDEIGHVAVGNRWYGWLCEQQALDPVAHYRVLARRHAAPRPRPPLNEAARRAAGFSDAEMAALTAA